MNEIAVDELYTCIFAEHQGCIFSASSVRCNVNYGFGKSAGCALQGHTLLKQCYTINFLKMLFQENLFLEQFPKIMCNLYTACNFTKTNSYLDVFLRIFKILAINYFS